MGNQHTIQCLFQVAVMRSDGTQYDGFYDRQLVVSVTQEGTSSTTTIPEDKQIIPDDNILNYEIIPGEDDRLIRVNVSATRSLVLSSNKDYFNVSMLIWISTSFYLYLRSLGSAPAGVKCTFTLCFYGAVICIPPLPTIPS